MNCLKIHHVRKRKIDGLSIDKFIEVSDESVLYLLDLDSHVKKEMNLKVYEELSGIFELWIDAAPRRHYDVMDILIIGGNKAVISSFFMKSREIKRSLEVTENVILKSYEIEKIEKFIQYGGKEILTSPRLAPFVDVKVYLMKGGEICPWRS